MSASNAGLNSYSSLNRQNRIKNLSNIIDNNRIMLKKIQQTGSNYDVNAWETANYERMKIK